VRLPEGEVMKTSRTRRHGLKKKLQGNGWRRRKVTTWLHVEKSKVFERENASAQHSLGLANFLSLSASFSFTTITITTTTILVIVVFVAV
jgi:hypothetical protein